MNALPRVKKCMDLKSHYGLRKIKHLAPNASTFTELRIPDQVFKKSNILLLRKCDGKRSNKKLEGIAL